MAFTVVAFYQVVDEGGVYTEIDPVEDEHVRVEGKAIFVPSLTRLLGYCAFLGSTASDAYLDAPSLRRTALMYLAQIEPLIVPDVDTLPVMNPKGLVELVATEGLKFVAKADPAAAEAHSCLVFLGDEGVEAVEGPHYAMEFIPAGTVTAGKWSNLSLRPVQALPAGAYQLVGANVVASGGLAYRLVIPGFDWRPGGICASGLRAHVHNVFGPGKLGVWGVFEHTLLPTLQLLSTTTTLPTKVTLWLKPA
ncbi:MAG: hypothetical protein QXF87_09170 [Thermofilaceae archaeon]